MGGAQIAGNLEVGNVLGGGLEVALFCKGVFDWLKEHSRPVFHSIKRWWGGEAAWERVHEDYKNARREIVQKNKDNDTRLKLLQELRSKFRTEKPQWADKFN